MSYFGENIDMQLLTSVKSLAVSFVKKLGLGRGCILGRLIYCRDRYLPELLFLLHSLSYNHSKVAFAISVGLEYQ